MMIKVRCDTNLDGYLGRDKWPSFMACRPLIGDRVQHVDGRHLYVVSVEHEFDGSLRVELGNQENRPYVPDPKEFGYC